MAFIKKQGPYAIRYTVVAVQNPGSREKVAIRRNFPCFKPSSIWHTICGLIDVAFAQW